MLRALVLLSVLLMLSGCGGDPPPAAPGKPSPSPTAAVAPVMPDKAKESSKAGAEAFVQHYLDVLNHAQATGGTDQLRMLEADTCRSCRRVRESIVELYQNGGRIIGGRFDASFDIIAPRPDLGISWSLYGNARYAPSKVVRGGDTESLTGGSTPVIFVVKFVHGRPALMNWTRES